MRTAKPLVDAQAFIRDVRNGLDDRELMTKYRIAGRQFTGVLIEFVDSDLSDVGGLQDFQEVGAVCADFTSIQDLRRTPRQSCDGVLAEDSRRPTRQCSLLDVSEQGFRLTGMDSRVGEVATFRIICENIPQIGSFEVDAKCRWTDQDFRGPESATSGYEIINISYGSFRCLKQLLDYLRSFESAGTPGGKDGSKSQKEPKARRISGAMLLKDLKAGLKCGTLMEKYRLSHDGLRNAVDQLLAAGVDDPALHNFHLKSFDDVVDVQVDGGDASQSLRGL